MCYKYDIVRRDEVKLSIDRRKHKICSRRTREHDVA